MNPKLKILIGILILGILIGGWSIFVLWRNPFPRKIALTITTDKREYIPREEVKITLMNNLEKEATKGVVSIERYSEKEEKWKDIEIGEFKIEEKFKDYVKTYGPAASLEVLPRGYRLTLSWIPVTREYMFLGEPEKYVETVALGRHRIKLAVQIGGEEKVFYSNEFAITAPTSANCDLFEMPMTEEEIEKCTCPEGYEKSPRLSGAYCATNSQKPCSAHADCPEGERCISSDGKSWFCTGQFAGCYFRDPENPEEQICAD